MSQSSPQRKLTGMSYPCEHIQVGFFFLSLTSVNCITFSFKTYLKTAYVFEVSLLVCILSRYKEQAISLRHGIWGVFAGPLSIAVSDPPEALWQNKFHLTASGRYCPFINAASMLYGSFEEDWVL